MATWDVRLFGQLSIARERRALDAPTGSKAQQLLAYLLIYRDRSHSREGLASLLWSDVSTMQSKKYLRQALWQLRSATASAADGGLLDITSDWARLNPRAALQLDVASFEQAFARTRGIAGTDLDDVQVAALQSAVELYRGDLLEGCYWDWCLRERERLQSTYVSMLEKLMSWCEAQRRFEEGIAYGQRVLVCDPAREATHQRLMRLLHASGDRAGALRQYERCAAALAQELEVEPSDDTSALYDGIRAHRAPTQRTPGKLAAGTLTETLASLADLHQTLLQLDRRLQEEMAVVRAALAGHHSTAAVTLGAAPLSSLRVVERRVGRRAANGNQVAGA